VRRMKEPALPTASHKVLPLCCGAFFRPPEAFAALVARVLPDLLERALPERPARVWIPGCATGEEAYSIAMLLIECFQACGRQPNVRIFATDAEASWSQEASSCAISG
jgi:two-component system CheB/CheR fusion protein